MKRLFFPFLTFLLSSYVTFGQLSIEDVDMSKIPYRKIRQYLNHQKERNIRYFVDLRASCNSGLDRNECKSMSNTYLVKEHPDTLWSIYKNTSATDAWDGKRSRCALLYSRNSDSLSYREDFDSSGVRAGQVFFLRLKLMKGLLNLPMGAEVIEIDTIKKRITFSYLEGNAAEGEQVIQLHRTREGHTKIIHVSYFKSESRLRDERLYPYFHTRIINDFHRNITRDVLDRRRDFRILGAGDHRQ